MNQKRLLLYGLVFFVTAIWGLNLVIIKVLVEDLPPQTMTAFRIMMAGITALIIHNRSGEIISSFNEKGMDLYITWNVIWCHLTSFANSSRLNND
ncbi:EamA family transporter [Bacillus subtilis]